MRNSIIAGVFGGGGKHLKALTTIEAEKNLVECGRGVNSEWSFAEGCSGKFSLSNEIENSEASLAQRESARNASFTIQSERNLPKPHNVKNLFAYPPNRLFTSKKSTFTLSEVFSPLFAGQCKTAFTLAEVLITLGIIGVVAALVMPSIHANVEKLILLTQLKSSYSILSNVVVRAKADYGDISSWGLDENFSKGMSSYSDVKNISYPIFQKYIVPYVQNVKFAKEMMFSQLGYKEGIKTKDGEDFAYVSSTIMALVLNNGVLIFPNATVLVDPETGEKVLGPDGERYMGGIVLFIDVNGAKRPNIIGKDVYVMSIPFTINGRVDLYRPYYFPDKTQPVLKYLDPSRESLLEECNTTGYYCGYLIQQDGWQFKDDYRW